MTNVPTYRGFIIEHDPLPIPIWTMDWSYYHKDHDGPGDLRLGRAASEESARVAVDDLIEELLQIEAKG